MKTDPQSRRPVRPAPSGAQSSRRKVQAATTAATAPAGPSITEHEAITTAPPKVLEEQLRQRFKRLAKLAARSIAVEARGGVVTLTGEVQSLQERDTATRAAWSMPGVTCVQNFLTIT